MKYLIALSALAFPELLMGQEALQKKNEVGIFCESNVLDHYDDRPTSTGGLMCKHAKTSLLSITASAGYTHTYEGGIDYRHPTKATKDTMMWKTTHVNTNLVMAGFGVEAQRSFYKKLSLFAGGEIRMSFGMSKRDTSIFADIDLPSGNGAPGVPTNIVYTSYASYPGPDMMVIQANLIPYIGLKVSVRKFNFGYALSNYMFSYRIESTGTDNYTFMNIELSNTFQRLFATYRF